MIGQQLGIQARRFNRGISPLIRRLESWKKYGSVRLVDFGGRQNVVCLENKRRAAKLSQEIRLNLAVEHTFSVDVYSPVDNKVWGAGCVTGKERGWHPSGGMWKTIECKIETGDKVVIDAAGREKETNVGDKAYFDLASIRVVPCPKSR